MARAFTIPAAAEVRVSAVLAARIVLRDAGRCVYCAAVLSDDETTVDHVRPQAHYPAGTAAAVVNAPTNLVTACADCNGAKGPQNLVGFAAMLRGRGVAEGDVRAMIARVRAATRRALP